MVRTFIDMPPYSPKSNGVVCLFELYKFLSKKGLDVVYLPRDILNLGFDIYKNQVISVNSHSLSLNLDEARRNDWIIGNDTTSKKLLKKARRKGLKILMWQLAPYSLLGRRNYPEIGDYNFPFSSCVNLNSNKYYYFQPKLDIYWRNSLEILDKNRNKIKRNTIAIYTGKGRISKLPKEIKELFKENDLILLSRNHPSDRSCLFKALLKCRALITFDSLTQLNLEAASLGIPIFIANKLFPKECYERFPVEDLKNRITADVQTFLNLYNKDLEPLKPSDLKENDQTVFNQIYDFITNKSAIRYADKHDIRNFKKFTSYLKNLNVIHPHINGGQSSGTLLIKNYCKNLINQKDNIFLNLSISFIENISSFLFKIKLLNLIELIIIRLKNCFIGKIFFKILFFLPELNTKLSRKYSKNYYFNKSLRWSKKGISLDQIFENKYINLDFDDNVNYQKIKKSNRTKKIILSKRNKSDKKTIFSIKDFQNPYLNLYNGKNNTLDLEYKIIDND